MQEQTCSVQFTRMQSLFILIGRALISALFLWSASGKLTNIEGTMQYMASKHMPFIPFFLFGALFLQLVGGLSLLLGYKARLGAWMLIFFIIPASIIFHDFWNIQGPEHLTEKIMFIKDQAILGALLILAFIGPGRLALDRPH